MTHPLTQKLHQLKNEKDAKLLAGFFKTGKCQYGEGDQFLGVKVPVVRALIQEEREGIDSLTLREMEGFMRSPWHEERLMGVLILVRRYEKGEEPEQGRILKGYLSMAKKGLVNNWDLVDQSAPNITGDWILKKDRTLLDRWVDSKKLWERRIAVVSTLTMIRNHDFEKTVEYSERLLGDTHDLMHKACGWMLREMGKRDERPLRKFLEKHTLKMPRTMLRYAIERLPEDERKEYLRRR
jgi:3-methyladenine DNA glycosylase AlkD